MESGTKPGGINGVSPPKRNNLLVLDFILRLLALGNTLSAAIIMGKDKQTVIQPQVGPLPAKYQYTPAFVFFVAANAIACGYTVLSLIFSLSGKRAVSTLSALLLSVTDLFMMELLTAGASAATAIASVGKTGNSHSHWVKICGIYDRFCHNAGVAIFTSFVGALMFTNLTVLSTYALYKRASTTR